MSVHPIHQCLCYVQLNLILPTVLESHPTPPASTAELWFVTREKAHLGDRNSRSSGHAQATERKLIFLCHFSLLYPKLRNSHAYCILRTVPHTPVYTQRRDQGGKKVWENVTKNGAECNSNFKYKITKSPPSPKKPCTAGLNSVYGTGMVPCHHKHTHGICGTEMGNSCSTCRFASWKADSGPRAKFKNKTNTEKKYWISLFYTNRTNRRFFINLHIIKQSGKTDTRTKLVWNKK